MPRSRMVELYLHSSVCLHGMVLEFKHGDSLVTFPTHKFTWSRLCVSRNVNILVSRERRSLIMGRSAGKESHKMSQGIHRLIWTLGTFDRTHCTSSRAHLRITTHILTTFLLHQQNINTLYIWMKKKTTWPHRRITDKLPFHTILNYARHCKVNPKTSTVILSCYCFQRFHQ
jgi:hypothetical protein